MEDTQIQAKRDSNGRWLEAPPGSDQTRITTANARSMAQKRWEKYRKAAAKGVLKEAQSIDPTVQTPAEAFGLLVSKQWVNLMETDKPVVDQVEKLGRMLTGMDTQNSQRENEPAPPNAITGTPETLARLFELMADDKRLAVERARAADTEATDIRNAE